jgi:hypothetical protein
MRLPNRQSINTSARTAGATVWAGITGGIVLVATVHFFQAPQEATGTQPNAALPIVLQYAALLVAALAIIFLAPCPAPRLAAFLLTTVALVMTFAALYLEFGNVQTLHRRLQPTSSPLGPNLTETHPPTFECFGHTIHRSDAIYFTIGTLTTAGTGKLTAESHACRSLATTQMVLDLALLAFGIARVTAGRGRRDEESRQTSCANR